MKRVNGSSCIHLRGTLLLLMFVFAAISTHFCCNATRWHPDWDKNIKLFYNKLLNRQLQLQQTKSRRSLTTGTDQSLIPNTDRNKKLMDLSSSDGITLGGHSMSSAFRLRKKRGSFRLRKRDPAPTSFRDTYSMNYLPLSYLDTYYALGKRRNHLNDEVSPIIPTTLHDGEDIMEEEKRASFRLKKIPQNAVNRSAHGAKRASFRLKRILDNYKDLLGSPSGSSSSAFRLRKRGGTSSFRLKRFDEEGPNEYEVENSLLSSQ